MTCQACGPVLGTEQTRQRTFQEVTSAVTVTDKGDDWGEPQHSGLVKEEGTCELREK